MPDRRSQRRVAALGAHSVAFRRKQKAFCAFLPVGELFKINDAGQRTGTATGGAGPIAPGRKNFQAAKNASGL